MNLLKRIEAIEKMLGDSRPRNVWTAFVSPAGKCFCVKNFKSIPRQRPPTGFKFGPPVDGEELTFTLREVIATNRADDTRSETLDFSTEAEMIEHFQRDGKRVVVWKEDLQSAEDIPGVAKADVILIVGDIRQLEHEPDEEVDHGY